MADDIKIHNPASCLLNGHFTVHICGKNAVMIADKSPESELRIENIQGLIPAKGAEIIEASVDGQTEVSDEEKCRIQTKQDTPQQECSRERLHKCRVLYTHHVRLRHREIIPARLPSPLPSSVFLSRAVVRPTR